MEICKKMEQINERIALGEDTKTQFKEKIHNAEQLPGVGCAYGGVWKEL